MLPQPTDGFVWVQAPAGAALVCRPLESVAPHFFTTRDWRLGSTSSADDDEAWEELQRIAGVDRAHLARLRQVHGAAVVVRRAGAQPDNSGAKPEADVIISNDRATAIAIQTADCVPLLFADPRTGAVAAAHAGWRGMAARAPIAAVEALVREFRSVASDLVVAAGPSIGACCYEVGEEVRARFESAGFSTTQLSRWFLKNPQPSATNRSMAGLPPAPRAHHWFFDGWTAAREQLQAAGVAADRFHTADLCTASHPDLLCSYRRDGSPAGRMAGVIRCAPPRPWPRWPADPHAR